MKKVEPYLLNELEADIAVLFARYRDLLDAEKEIEGHLRRAREAARRRYAEVSGANTVLSSEQAHSLFARRV